MEPFPPLGLEVARLTPGSWFSHLLEYPPIKALIPFAVILAIAPAVWWFFRDTWRELDDEARAHARSSDERDYRPYVALVLLAATLTVQDYYGGQSFYASVMQPVLAELEADGAEWIQLRKFSTLYGYAWWSMARVLGYVVVPLIVWKLVFPKDRVLDMGLRGKGFLSHVWIYLLCLAVVFGAMAIVAQQPDFLSYYPFYKLSSRSWFDLLCWEALYFLQFLALEFYFRGWLLAALRRSLGAAAIFVMAAPYCMIHFGKPYLEAQGAIIAGVVLGSLAMKTRSIYAGFLVHVTVAGLMDYFALASRNGLPKAFWP
jgi:membrane protease YdiL (CAAX protease family)